MVNVIKKGIQYLQNQEVDLNTRMLFLLEHAVLFAAIIGTIVMAALTSSIYVLIPNFIILVSCVIGLYFTRAKKQYDVAAAIIVSGSDYIALTFMYFTAGGFRSGMPIWFLFGIAFTCMMIRGKLKIVMTVVSIFMPCSCMIFGQLHPEYIRLLDNSQAQFLDMFQSFVIVSVIFCTSLTLYLNSYDKQRQMLELKSQELKKAINTDIMTGAGNRHAFYEDSVKYIDSGYKENLVLATLDINGLKSVNDTKGHAEGDILIQSAAEILTNAFSKYGKVYRIGGDEFAVLMFCSDEQAESLVNELKEQTKIHNENKSENVSMAMGVAVWNKNKEMKFSELQRLADFDMYKNKNDFYSESHIDRRMH